MDFIVKQALGGWDSVAKQTPLLFINMVQAFVNGFGATKDLNKLMDEKKEVDPKQAEAAREQLEALEEQENERKAKHMKIEEERELERQRIRDKYGLKRKDQIEAEERAAREMETAGRLTREKKVPGQEEGEEEEDESLLNQAEKALGEFQQKVSTATESCIIS